MSKDINKDPFKESFKAFVWAAWKFLSLPPPTDVQADICDYLQYGPRRKVVEAFRGVGKSWITAAYVLWRLYRDPQLNVLVVSASKPRADDFSTFCLRLLAEWPLLSHLHPTDDQRCSKIAFDVRPAEPDHAPSVKSAGITGQITGSRADIIVADDIEVPGNSDTQAARDKLSEQVKEFDAILKPLPTSEIVYLGTPQCEMSLYNALPERGYSVRIWPARIPVEGQIVKYGTKLAPFVHDMIEKGALPTTPVDPKRFDHEDLMERELSYGRSGFALQFMLDTSLSDADRYPLRLSDLIVMPLDPHKGPTDVMWANGREQILEGVPVVGMDGDRYHRPMVIPQEYAEYTGSVMFIDPAGRGKDEVGYAVVNNLMGRLFLMDAGGMKGGYEDKNLQVLAKVAQRYKVKRVLIEPNFGDGMFAQVLKPVMSRVYPVTIEDAKWSQVSKEQRIIDVLEPVMNQHRLVVDQGLIERDYRSTQGYSSNDVNRCRLFYQMTRLTRERGALYVDDRIDALAGAVGYWVENMARDSAKALKSHKADLLDAELRKFVQHAVGKKNMPKQSPTVSGVRALKKTTIRMR